MTLETVKSYTQPYNDDTMKALMSIITATVQQCIYRYITELTALHYETTMYGAYLPDYPQAYHDPVLKMADICSSAVKAPMLGFLANNQDIEGVVQILGVDYAFLDMWHERWRVLENHIYCKMQACLQKRTGSDYFGDYQGLVERLNKNPFPKLGGN